VLKSITSSIPTIIAPMLKIIELLLDISGIKKDGKSFFEVIDKRTILLLMEWAMMHRGRERLRTMSQPRKIPRKKVYVICHGLR